MSPNLGRILLAAGFGALLAAVGNIRLIAAGSMGFWSSGMIALLLFTIAGLLLPFAVMVSWGRL